MAEWPGIFVRSALFAAGVRSQNLWVPRTVFVVSGNESLRRSVVSRLAREDLAPVVGATSLFEVSVGAESVALVISTECPPHCCGYLIAGGGLRMAVLAALPNAHEQHAYERLGARYVPMSLDSKPLVASVRELLTVAPPDRLRAREAIAAWGRPGRPVDILRADAERR